MISSNLFDVKKSFQELFNPPQGQIKALDGVRAFAILLVLGLHSGTAIQRAGLEQAVFASLPPFRGGWIGVPLFFVLSGFFIGSQIWKELQAKGTVKVGRFFFRRGMRIWPLYYFVFGCSYFTFPENAQNFWSNILFVANYFGDSGPVRGSWSLSIEEQFYLLFPTIVFISARFFHGKSLSFYRKMLIVGLFLAPVSRLITWYSVTGFEFYDVNLYMQWIYRPLHTNFDGLLVGLLISNVKADKELKYPTFLLHCKRLILLVALVTFGLTWFNKVVFFYSALALTFGSVVWMCLNEENGTTKLLSHRALFFVAKVSYGMYLVHHPILWSMEKLGWFVQNIVNPEVHLMLTYFLVIVLSSIVCAGTYIFIEAPFLKLRNEILQGKQKEPSYVIQKKAS